jgi:putative transposase
MTMTELIDPTDPTEMIESMTGEIVDQKQLAEQLLAQAREQNIELVGPGGLLNQLTKNVLETALDAELVEHLGYEKHDPAGRNSGNSRNGTRPKTVLTEIGPVEIEVPRDTASTFDPQIVRKRQRRLTGVDEIVLSLTARGLTTGEVAAHFGEVYGARISKDTISQITEKVTAEMTEWLHRPLDEVYPVIFIDAMVVKVRDGQVMNKPVYVVIGVTVNGERDILGLWAGDGGEGAKFWLGVFTEGSAGGDHDHSAARDRPGLCDPSDPQHIPVRVPPLLGRDEPGPAPGLHRTIRASRPRAVRRVRREVGPAVPGDHPTMGERLERVRAVP